METTAMAGDLLGDALDVSCRSRIGDLEQLDLARLEVDDRICRT